MPTVTAPAKVNLFLHVLAREASGYHQIETLFCLIELADELIIEAGSSGIHLEIDGVVPGNPEDNLVCRAARLFHEKIGTPPSIRVQLRKRIPAGAGLGGGSSDAAATLHALNDMHGAPLDRESLLDVAASIGSDVPFFAAQASLALAWGRGERLLTLDPLPTAPMVIATPAVPMPTAEAYSALASLRSVDGPPISPRILATDDCSAWDRIARLVHNDFEDVVLDRIPTARTLRNALIDGGARIAMLSGSGSAVFGVFDDSATRDAAAAATRAAVPGSQVFETRSASPPGVDRGPVTA